MRTSNNINHASPYSDFQLLHPHHHHHHMSSSSSQTNSSRAYEFSPRDYFSNGFDSSSDSSSSTAPFGFKHYMNEANPAAVSHHDSSNFNEILGGDIGLAGYLNGMSIGGGVRRRGGFGLGGYAAPWNVDNYGLFASVKNNVCDVRGCSNGYVEPEFLGVKQHNEAGAFFCGANGVKNQRGFMLEQRRKELIGECYYSHVEEHNPCLANPYLDAEYVYSQLRGIDSSREKGHAHMYPLAHQLCVDNGAHNYHHHRHPVMQLRTRGNPTRKCEDGLVVQGSKQLNDGVTKACLQASKANKEKAYSKMAMRTEGEKVSRLDWDSYSGGSSRNDSCSLSNNDSVKLPPSLRSLADIHGYVYCLAKDQRGGRYLQKILDEGTPQDVQLIFDGIINHVLELTTDPFGNYLMQKFLDISNEQQRMQLVFEVTKQSGELVRVSLDTHGTRVVQKMIDTVENGKEVSLIISSLEYGFVDLIKDPDGYHVVYRCLETFSIEQNSFIFDAAARFCVEIATQRHGCCALQKCISHATGRHRVKLVTEVSRNGLLLSQDPFGNYVVQYVIELNIPSVMIRLISQLKGHFVLLSRQKFGSHVVEKCIKHCEESRAKIIQEFLSVSHFEQMLQDPYANYVVQSALSVTKGPLHAALVKAVKPHTILRHSPYCKKIFTKDLLKK